MKTADAKTRNKLKEVRDRLAVKRTERVQLRQQRDACRDAFGEADFANDTDITKTQEFLDAEQAVGAVGRVEDDIAGLESAESAILKLLGSDESYSSNGHGRSNGNGPGGGIESHVGWNGRAMLAQSDSYQAAQSEGVFTSDAHFGTIVLGRVCDRENFASFVSPNWAANIPTAPAGAITSSASTNLIPPDARGILPTQLRPLNLLDVIPVGTTDSNMIAYVQVTGVPGYAAETAEGALKPQEGIAFTDATAPVRTIAGYIKMNRQAMDDTAGLATLVNTLLPYDVRRRLEAQMLQGDGTGQNLLGILGTSGIGAPASVAGDNIMDGILRAITTVVLSDADPTWVALNPLTYQSMSIMKASGTGEYMLDSPGGVEAHYSRGTVWGLTPVRNRLVPQATPIVGDPMGATLLVREGVNIKTSDADQDDFIRNRVTVLAETRVAFPVWRPASFAKAPLG
jgi:HK97 family phage major capsid protein